MKPAAPGAIDTVIMSVKNADLWDGMKKAVLPPNSDAKLVTGLGDDAFMNRAIGYNVRITVGADGKSYVATAEPTRYGHTGKLSFWMDQTGNIKKLDNGGKPISGPK